MRVSGAKRFASRPAMLIRELAHERQQQQRHDHPSRSKPSQFAE
jgi:hypothetical protein